MKLVKAVIILLVMTSACKTTGSRSSRVSNEPDVESVEICFNDNGSEIPSDLKIAFWKSIKRSYFQAAGSYAGCPEYISYLTGKSRFPRANIYLDMSNLNLKKGVLSSYLNRILKNIEVDCEKVDIVGVDLSGNYATDAGSGLPYELVNNTLGQCNSFKKISYLSLKNNGLKGNIGSFFNDLAYIGDHLQMLDVSQNALTSSIDIDFWNGFPNLIYFDGSENAIDNIFVKKRHPLAFLNLSNQKNKGSPGFVISAPINNMRPDSLLLDLTYLGIDGGKIITTKEVYGMVYMDSLSNKKLSSLATNNVEIKLDASFVDFTGWKSSLSNSSNIDLPVSRYSWNGNSYSISKFDRVFENETMPFGGCKYFRSMQDIRKAASESTEFDGATKKLFDDSLQIYSQVCSASL